MKDWKEKGLIQLHSLLVKAKFCLLTSMQVCGIHEFGTVLFQWGAGYKYLGLGLERQTDRGFQLSFSAAT